VNPPRGRFDLTRGQPCGAAARDPSRRDADGLTRQGLGEPLQCRDREIGRRERFGECRLHAVAGQPFGELVLAIGGLERRSRRRRPATLTSNLVHGRQLLVGEPCRRERPGGTFLVVYQRDQRLGRPRGGRRRVVQLVGEP
jgi:hypothetical protein